MHVEDWLRRHVHMRLLLGDAEVESFERSAKKETCYQVTTDIFLLLKDVANLEPDVCVSKGTWRIS